ncbi:MAG: LuxR family transcriptional regulator [Gammaproteobacteria bacterium]|nr:LuxR family transcriptional regulator [Gammaproteobacteria bacterium]
MTIIHKHTDYCDIFEMSAPKNHLNTDEFYTANIDLLQNYAAYFMEAAEKIITNAEQNKFILEYPDDYDRYHEYEDLETGLIDETKQPLITKSELYSLLTIREKQILAWLFQGKTSAEIAIILGISRRTVEKFIPRLKIKSNCQSLFQLGAKLSLLQYRLMLEEFIMAPNHKHRT